jgi:hypothetical protein
MSSKHMSWMLIAAALALACQPDFERMSQVDRFRVLGVSAEPPEIAPGDGTELAVLWADPKGGGREVAFAWLVCDRYVKVSQGPAACVPVFPPHVATASAGGDALSIPWTPPDMLEELPAGDSAAKASVFVLLCAGGALPAAEELIAAAAVADTPSDLCVGGEGLTAFKTVTISESTEPNRNPAIERLELNGVRLDPVEEDGLGVVFCDGEGACGSKAELKVFLTPSSAQTYQTVELGKPKIEHERLYVTWFATAGRFDADRSGADDPLGPYEVRWKPKELGELTLWVVAHDVRGGVSWRTYRIEVRPS